MVSKIGQELMRSEEDGERLRGAVDVYLNCLQTTFQLPKPSHSAQQEKLAMLNYFCGYMADLSLHG